MSNNLCHPQLMSFAGYNYGENFQSSQVCADTSSNQQQQQQQQLELILLALTNQLAYVTSQSKHLNHHSNRIQTNFESNHDGNNNHLQQQAPIAQQTNDYTGKNGLFIFILFFNSII